MREGIKTNYDRCTYERRTAQVQAQMQWYRDIVQKCNDDTDKKERHAEGLCPLCYYEPRRQGGARSTLMICAFCEKEKWFGSTAIDVACKECAVEKKICRTCGADVDLKMRRKAFIEEQKGEGNV